MCSWQNGLTILVHNQKTKKKNPQTLCEIFHRLFNWRPKQFHEQANHPSRPPGRCISKGTESCNRNRAAMQKIGEKIKNAEWRFSAVLVALRAFLGMESYFERTELPGKRPTSIIPLDPENLPAVRGHISDAQPNGTNTPAWAFNRTCWKEAKNWNCCICDQW